MPIIVPASGVRAGTVAHFAANTPPAGWLACNGAAVSRTLYGALFLAIGTTYGAGDGSTTFNLPDLRGEFIRGHDGGRNVDAGRVFGTAQGSQNLSHSHSASTGTAGNHAHQIRSRVIYMSGGGNRALDPQSGADEGMQSNPAGDHAHTVTVNADGGTEARPRNVAMLACIRF